MTFEFFHKNVIWSVLNFTHTYMIIMLYIFANLYYTFLLIIYI